MPDPFPAALDLPLKKPLKSEGGDVSSLALHEPSALDLEQAEGDLGLLARIAGIDPKALGALAASDYSKALEYLQSFTRPGQLIGGEPGMLSQEAVPENYTLTLLKPLDKAGEQLFEIELTEPTASHLNDGGRALNWVTNNLTILQLVTRLPIGILRQMGARDFSRASEYIRFFTRAGQLTGAG